MCPESATHVVLKRRLSFSTSRHKIRELGYLPKLPPWSCHKLCKMDSLSKVVKVTVPNYLSELPIPESIGGIFRLSGKF